MATAAPLAAAKALAEVVAAECADSILLHSFVSSFLAAAPLGRVFTALPLMLRVRREVPLGFSLDGRTFSALALRSYSVLAAYGLP